jgi:hypothetical protein
MRVLVQISAGASNQFEAIRLALGSKLTIIDFRSPSTILVDAVSLGEVSVLLQPFEDGIKRLGGFLRVREQMRPYLLSR